MLKRIKRVFKKAQLIYNRFNNMVFPAHHHPGETDAEPLYKAITADYTMELYDKLLDATSGTFRIIAPPAADIPASRVYTIKNSGTGIITFVPSGSETIDGTSSITLGAQYDTLAFTSDGTNLIRLLYNTTVNGVLILQKGADVASAAGLPLGTDGNSFDITGTATITSIATLGVGAHVTLHFDGILTLTHHATDLILPGATNITTAAGDIAVFYEYASGDWRCVSYQVASVPVTVGRVVNFLGSVSTTTVRTTTATIPYDDTIPQITEGGLIITSASAAPASATNKFFIDVSVHFAHTATGIVTIALFQDNAADALFAESFRVDTVNAPYQVSFEHIRTTGTTSATVFTVRAGSDTAGTLTISGVSGARKLGGVGRGATLRIIETLNAVF